MPTLLRPSGHIASGFRQIEEEQIIADLSVTSTAPIARRLRAIQHLEKEFGGYLFDRRRSKVRLTELGKLVQPYLQEIMSAGREAAE